MIITLNSCKYEKPAFRYSNYNNTPVENIVKAIKKEEISTIKREVKKGVNINFKDKKYDLPLLSLAIVKDKKKSFLELLKLNANPNVKDKDCEPPLVLAIRYNQDCNLFYIKNLLKYGANVTPELFKRCNYYTHDPIIETILHYNDENKIKCGMSILNLLIKKTNNTKLLLAYNTSKDYKANVVFNCLSIKNLYALKYLIVDSGYSFPDKIFIDGTVLLNHHGYYTLDYILNNRHFVFENSEKREQTKNEILNFLKK